MSTKSKTSDETKNETRNVTESATKAAESVVTAAMKIIEDAAAKSREQYESAVDTIGPRLKTIKVPAGASGAVDGYFDFAGRVLESQRQFVTKLLNDSETDQADKTDKAAKADKTNKADKADK